MKTLIYKKFRVSTESLKLLKKNLNKYTYYYLDNKIYYVCNIRTDPLTSI